MEKEYEKLEREISEIAEKYGFDLMYYFLKAMAYGCLVKKEIGKNEKNNS